MPKKSRRTKAKYRAGAKPAQGKHLQQAELATVKPPLSTRVLREPQDSANRYQYVIPEVKRIAILAGVMIVTLIVLSFVFG